MRKLFSIIALLCIGTMFSQGSTNVTVNVTIAPVMSIKTAPTQAIVAIPITTAAHYINGNSAQAPSQLEITSTLGYQVTAKASQDLTNGSQSFPINKLKLSLTNGSGGNATPTFATSLPLSTSTDQQVISTTGGDIQRFVTVDYAVDGGAHLVDLAGGTYTTTVTYTITAP